MKRAWVIIVNVIIMIAMLTFVIIYSNIESGNSIRRQTEYFENTTITMKHVTENYLEGEQRICDVWARYISSKDMSIDEAVSFIRISHVLPNASAHIVYADTLTGLSTKAANTLKSAIRHPDRGRPIALFICFTPRALSLLFAWHVKLLHYQFL